MRISLARLWPEAIINRFHNFLSPAHGIRDCADRRRNSLASIKLCEFAGCECSPRSTARACGPRPHQAVHHFRLLFDIGIDMSATGVNSQV